MDKNLHRPRRKGHYEDNVHLSAEMETLINKEETTNPLAKEIAVSELKKSVDAQLDLARRYKEIGNIAEAQALLQEVLHSGNIEQQTEATLLLSRMHQS